MAEFDRQLQLDTVHLLTMTLFAHRSCGLIVAEYVGDAPIVAGTPLLRKDWRIGGEQPEPGSVALYCCPRCGETFGISSYHLEEIWGNV